MEWLSDPNVFAGLITLVVLEIVLGIDNLVFIAILAEKLPIVQQQKARIVGLACALVMRLILLSMISWITTLTAPLFSMMGWIFSTRDLVMVSGGLFLLTKGTMELHHRLEVTNDHSDSTVTQVAFWQVITQIVILDAVFSLDSIITAVGMVQYVPVMMLAVIFAIAVMMLASELLTAFVNRHPTIVVLCLGFLMMIGFSLMTEGFGFYLPKGYLYAAIGFSIFVEIFNQIARKNREKLVMTHDLRSRTARMVLRLLGGERGEGILSDTVDVIAEKTAASAVFRPEEKQMIRSVLDLAKRPVRSIMSPRHEVEWLDLSSNDKQVWEELKNFKHSRIILAHEKIDEFVGVAFTRDLLLNFSINQRRDWQKVMRQPLVVHENTSVLRMMEQLRRTSVQLVIIVDEHGSFEGIATPIDILEAIAGDFPEDEDPVLVEREANNSLVVEGYADIRRLSGLLERDLVDENDRYTTLAGYMLWHFSHIPVPGESFEADGFLFAVLEMERRNISKVRVTPLSQSQ